MVVVRMVVLGMLVVRTQNLQSPFARGSGTRGCGARGSVRTQNFQSPAARGSGTNAKFSYVQPRVVVLRTQNFLIPGSRVSGTRGSGRKAKFSKTSSAW